MARADISLPQLQTFGETSRKDAWWLSPIAVFIALTAFVVFGNWVAFQGANYFYDGGGAHYLSPFYSPLLYGAPNEPRWIAATQPGWWPSWMPFSAAFLVLLGPVGMRGTCYYYRGAYYKAFWADPIACAVGEPSARGTKYRGERWLPLVLQNVHRYFFYIAVFFVIVLTWDGLRAFVFTTPDGGHRFGIGIGSIVLLVNAILIGGYTFGCHCARHLFGGNLDRISDHPVRRVLYNFSSWLNARHMQWAWFSLVWVAFADIYVRLLCTGVISDVRIL